MMISLASSVFKVSGVHQANQYITIRAAPDPSGVNIHVVVNSVMNLFGTPLQSCAVIHWDHCG